MNRRQFFHGAVAGGAAIALSPRALKAANAANRTLRVATLGVNGRGIAHIRALLSNPDVEVIGVCDPDSRAVAKGLAAAAERQDKVAQGYSDFRDVLELKELDAITVATPNHWHAPATILALSAGKHVYVEKPGSHNPYEAQFMVNAARYHDKRVQMGNQRRSWPWVQEAIQRLHEGELGELTFARTWYNNRRGSIGQGSSTSVPEWLDYDVWQGPAPRRDYNDNVVHYDWHWRWHWGNGELGNNGIHALDIARWGLRVDCPVSVTCTGGRYRYQDDQETPDTTIASYHFGSKGASWEGHSCDPRGFEGVGFGIHFYGPGGSLVIAGNNYAVYDENRDLVTQGSGPGGDSVHFGNFLDSIREDAPLTAPIADAQTSTMLCHYGNIAYRSQSALSIDTETGRIQENQKAARLWRRDYAPGYEPVL